MPCTIVTVSRTAGSGGESVAQLVAEKLSFRYVDNDIIVQAAERAGISAAEVAAAESPKPLLLRIIESIGAAGVGAPEATMAGVNLIELPPATERLIEAVVRETAEAGKVVIVAHAAGIPLAGMAGLLRVEVTASEETRAGRITEAQGLSGEDAEKEVRNSDKARAEYLQRFYKITDERPTLFDLVINTDVLSAEQAATVVEAAAKTM
jgi:cytidylate kinase